MSPRDDVMSWLLDSDPALRWQVERDLVGVPEAVWQATRARVPREGMGAALLARQDADGQWAGGAFFPADFTEEQRADGQPWTATTWSLKQLREWGVAASVLDGTAEKLRTHARWEYDDLPYWDGEVDCCINGYTLAAGAWLGVDVSGIARWFVEHRQPDGGWNCEWVEGSTRSSFPSTLNALEGVLAYERAGLGFPELTAARHGAEQYLLERRVLYGLRSGEPVVPYVHHLAYPFRHVYSALHAADYFRASALFDGVAPDPRLADAIASIRSKRGDDGRWVQEHRHPGAVWFDVDVPEGEASPWLTFLSLRVLEWWDAASALAPRGAGA
ncbi:MAG: squalene cyclase [Microbacterium sp.]|uniref:Squalene cyclase n=3 Tax=Microbacterium ginsengisoli TaxID=400772 RepID=A0A0F0LV80_9MICO|nr:hypothetical protein [Microbacterium ginsengisoli]KJL37202.1 hypothetical protein RR49_01090 [Microbacterium ginsengisoli]MAL07941.1 squalene cyclase [Microbacterium sp.]MBN9209694.1 squalene cyclase [Microbacterium ginsengisoli]